MAGFQYRNAVADALSSLKDVRKFRYRNNSANQLSSLKGVRKAYYRTGSANALSSLKQFWPVEERIEYLYLLYEGSARTPLYRTDRDFGNLGVFTSDLPVQLRNYNAATVDRVNGIAYVSGRADNRIYRAATSDLTSWTSTGVNHRGLFRNSISADGTHMYGSQGNTSDNLHRATTSSAGVIGAITKVYDLQYPPYAIHVQDGYLYYIEAVTSNRRFRRVPVNNLSRSAEEEIGRITAQPGWGIDGLTGTADELYILFTIGGSPSRRRVYRMDGYDATALAGLTQVGSESTIPFDGIFGVLP